MQAFLANTYFYIDRWLVRIGKAIRATHQGVWLGLLDRPGLRKASELYYSRANRYQSEKHNKAGLFDWEQKAITTYFSGCESILVAASGGGREVIALAQEDRRVTGFDCTPPLVEHARERVTTLGLAVDLQDALPDQVPEALGRFDGAIIGWGAYIHIAGRDSRIKFLQQVRRHIDPGGPLLVSFFIRQPESRALGWSHRIGHTLSRLLRHEHKTELGDSLDGSFDHYFDEPELRDELSQAGFDVVHFASDPFGHAVAKVHEEPGSA